MEYRQPAWIVARDRARGYVLLGGLGGMGVGEMWFPDGEDMRKKEGYDQAPERNSEGGFGGPPVGEQPPITVAELPGEVPSMVVHKPHFPPDRALLTVGAGFWIPRALVLAEMRTPGTTVKVAVTQEDHDAGRYREVVETIA
jgi:hypothetical protein